MIVKYINSAGTEVNLNQSPYKMLVSDILDYEWEPVEVSGKIAGFKKAMASKEINIDVLKDKAGSRQNLSFLTDIFEKDVVAVTPGKLYIDESVSYTHLTLPTN